MASRIPINLAAQPVERIRAARRVVFIAALLILLATGLQVAALGWMAQQEEDAARPEATIGSDEVAAWQREVDQLVDAADVGRARSAANAVAVGAELIGWHAIPWRAIFVDLEEVLPRRVRLEVVAPGLAPEGGVAIQMTAAAADTGPLQDFMLALEEHPEFVQVWPLREDAGPDGMMRLTLQARYVRQEER